MNETEFVLTSLPSPNLSVLMLIHNAIAIGLKVVASLWSLPRTVAAAVVVVVVAVDIARMAAAADIAVTMVAAGEASHSIFLLISCLDANLKLGAWR